MELIFETKGNTTIVNLNGRLDTSNYTELEEKLLKIITKGSAILVDCAGLDYISSSGLRVLLLALKKAELTDSKLALCSLQDRIMEIFKISAFDSIFTIFQNQEEALEKYMDTSD